MAIGQKSGEPNRATFRTDRVVSYQREAVFDAFARQELLAQWWGPERIHQHLRGFRIQARRPLEVCDARAERLTPSERECLSRGTCSVQGRHPPRVEAALRAHDHDGCA